ncbi:MAG: flippase [Bradymonadaceae bacterium]
MPDDSTQQEAADTVSEVASESTLVVLARGASIVLGFLATFVLGRLYGPEDLGRYSLARTVVFVASIATVLGFHQGLAKYVPRFRDDDEPHKLGVLTRTAATATTGFALAAAFGMWVGSDLLAVRLFDDPGMARVLWWAAAIVVPFTAVRAFSGLYRGLKVYGLYAVVKQAGLRLVLVAGLLAAWALGWGTAVGALGVYFVAAAVVVVWCVGYARRFDLDFSPIAVAETDEGRDLQREVLAFSSTMIFVAAMNFLMRKVDILMAGVFLEASRVGIYRIAATVSLFAAFFVKASNAVFSAVISELFDAGRRELLQRTYSSITKWIVVLTLPVVISFWMFPSPIVGFFGAAYTDGALALQVLSAGTFCSAAVGATGYILVMGEYERLQLVNNTVVAALNVGLNWLLIPRYGIAGAAMATAVSFAAIAVLRVVEIRLLLDLFPYDFTFLPIPAAAAAMVGLAYGARPIVGGVPMVLVVTAANLGVGLAVMYWFRTDLDRRLFRRVREKVESVIT